MDSPICKYFFLVKKKKKYIYIIVDIKSLRSPGLRASGSLSRPDQQPGMRSQHTDPAEPGPAGRKSSSKPGAPSGRSLHYHCYNYLNDIH